MANLVTTAIEKKTDLVSQNSGESVGVSYMGRTVTPISHGTFKIIQQHKSASSGTFLTCIILAVGIILWAIGAANKVPNLALSGKVIFGIGFVPILAGCLHSYCFPNHRSNHGYVTVETHHHGNH